MSRVNTLNFKELHKSLRVWFIIHCFADLLCAIPIMLFPLEVLGFLGWEVVDPFATRLVAAALFGIGLESFLGRNAGQDTFKGMLNLKIIWSMSAIIGICLSLISGATHRPLFAWILLVVFIAFNILWTIYRIVLARLGD